jgi:hypothetical protein
LDTGTKGVITIIMAMPILRVLANQGSADRVQKRKKALLGIPGRAFLIESG